jgi:hypothetical protein
LASRFLEASASERTNAKFAQRLGLPPTHPVVFPVFETTLGEKTVYCCLAGGHRDRDGEVEFTEIGQAAFEALLRLPLASEPTLLRELKRGRVPLRRQIRETVEAAPPGARICFFGDMAGELKGVAVAALNVQADMVWP